MLEIIPTIQLALDQKRPVAYCRLVETRGSTPQKAGAAMLVFENGEQAGTLGGGCVEAEVKRNAIRTLHNGTAELTTFSLDHDYGWDDGLICGGRMTILVEPIVSNSTEPDTVVTYFRTLIHLAELGGGFTEAIVFDAEKSGLPAPASFLFDANDSPAASLHTDLEHAETLRPTLQPIASRPRPYATSGVAVLPLAQRCRLVIVGGGHVGQAVAQLAADLDFEVWVTDDRDRYVSEERFPRAKQRIAGPCRDVLPTLDITPDTYCLIVTRGHNHDQEALFRLIDRDARYVGMIGSKRKIRKIFEDLIDEGVSQESLDRVHAPVGLDIGSQTVLEIAVSIAAELVAHRNCDGHVPGRSDGSRAHAEID